MAGGLFHTVASLDDRTKRGRTPEGYLVCRDVPIARTGSQFYVDGETPIRGDVTVDRDEAEVFRPETIASFNGKPVVEDHPFGDVLPTNWHHHAVGTVLHPRRGEGDQADLLLADLLVYRPSAIRAIEAGKRQVSCGYKAEYERTGDGRARQHTIVGNHVALVDSARCGSACSIADHQPGSRGMKTARQRVEELVLLAGSRTHDTGELAELAREASKIAEPLDLPKGGEGETGVHVHVGAGATPVASAGGPVGNVVDEDPDGMDDRVSDLEDKVDDHDDLLSALMESLGMDEGDVADAVKDARAQRAHDTAIRQRTADRAAKGRRARDEESVEEKREREARMARMTDRRKKAKDAWPRAKAKDTDGESPEEKAARELKEREAAAASDAKRAADEAAKKVDEEALKREGVPAGAKDSNALVERWRGTVAMAEVILPGLSVSTFDGAAMAPQDGVKRICDLRRATLDAAHARSTDLRQLVNDAAGGDYAAVAPTMTCDRAASIFQAVYLVRRQANNTAGGSFAARANGGPSHVGSIAELNKRHDDFYKLHQTA